MRAKLSDWKVGEKVIFVSSHSVTDEPTDMVVKSVGRKFLSVGHEGALPHTAQYRFKYVGNKLRFEGGYGHRLYLPEEYRLMHEYNKALKAAASEIGFLKYDPEKWTEENIKRLNMILELVKAIKDPVTE